MIYDEITKTQYNLLDLGFSKSLTKAPSLLESTPEMVNVFTSGLAPKNLLSGELISSVEQQTGVLFAGKTGFTNVTAGYRLGIDTTDELLKFYIGNSSNYLNWTGTTLTIVGGLTASSGSIGGFDIGSDYIRDAANSFGLASAVTGSDDVRFWAGGTYANRATANLRIYESGNVSIDYGADLTLIQGGDINFTSVTTSGACTATLIATGTGNINNGTHSYKVTFVNSAGETSLGTVSNTVTVDASNKQVNLSSIPVSSSNSVTARKIYRTKAGGSTYFLLTTISDNTTTTYTDNTADANLTGGVADSRENNSFGKMFIDSVKSLSLGGTNTFVGQNAGGAITTGFENTALGVNALLSNTTGDDNTALGIRALRANTSGANNIAIGTEALVANTTANDNIAIGVFCLPTNTTGHHNVAMGASTMELNGTGDYNVAIGVESLVSNVSGDFNTAIGGRFTGYNALGSSNVFIGYQAGKYETGSNSLYIDNQDRTNTAGDKAKALLYGVFATTAAGQKLTINGLFNLSVTKTPASAAATGTLGDIAWDTSFIYVCTATDTWKRVAIATW